MTSKVIWYARSALIILILLCSWSSELFAEETAQPLNKLTLEELLKVTITTASKSEKSLAKTPAFVTLIDKQQIKANGWKNLSDILNAQAGFFVFSDRIYDFVVARGNYQANDPNSRILLLLNGHSVIEGFGYFNGQLASVDINHIERVEIVRGPGSAIYGTNAMFAVINVITKKQVEKETTSAVLELGDDSQKKLSMRGDWPTAFGQVSLLASTEHSGETSLFFDEYIGSIHPEQGVTDPSSNQMDVNNFLFDASFGEWSVAAYFNRRLKRVPTGLFGGRTDKTFFEDINTFFEFKRVYNLNKTTRVSLRGIYDNYEFKGRFYYFADPSGVNGPAYGSEFNSVANSSFGFEALFDSSWTANTRLIYGVEVKKYGDVDFVYVSENDPLQLLNERFNFDPKESIASLFAAYHVDYNEKFSSVFGLHYDYYQTVGGHLSPKASLSYQASANSLVKVLYGEAFRAPNSWELNGGFFLIGNPDLTPETSRSFELIYDYQMTKQWFWHTSLFANETQNSIRQAPDGVDFINSEGVKSSGGETEIRYLNETSQGYASLSHASSQNQQSNQQISFAPKNLFKLGYTYQFNNRISFNIETQWVDSRLLADQTQLELPAYSVTNLTLSSVEYGPLSFSFSVDNVFDKAYQHPAFTSDLASFYVNTSFPVYDIPGDGRSYRLKAQFDW